MRKLQKTVLTLLMLVSCSVYLSAQGPQTFFESFTGISEGAIAVWNPGNNSTRVIENGHYMCLMANQGSAYRGDVKYNNPNNSLQNQDYCLTLYPSVDGYMAVKFIGKRPANTATYTKGFKLEMKYETTSGEEAWLNTQWNNGEDGYVVTENGNHVYYFDLTKDATYLSMAEVKMLFFNLIIADVDAEPYQYTIDWIGTFASLEDIEVYKTFADDGEEDKDEVIIEPELPVGLFESFTDTAYPDAWRFGNNATGEIKDGHLVGYMADQGEKYRGDVRYNNITNNNLISKDCYFRLIPASHRYFAVKFIGTRPHGSLKFEMRSENENWINNTWNGGNPSFITTEAGNYIYYFELTANENYANGGEIVIELFNLTIADSEQPPYEYIIDWIGFFESFESIEAFKDTKDDGENDRDEELAGVIIEEQIVAVYNLSENELNDTNALTLFGNWQERHFNMLKVALGENEVITSIDLTSVKIADHDFLSGIKNPNCLIFVSADTSYPESWKNVIVDNRAQSIFLTDGYPYSSPKEFNASVISYTRNYTVEGWASLCLPFDIGVSELPQGVNVYEFTKAEGTSVTFDKVEENMIRANTPYIADISGIDSPKVFEVFHNEGVVIPVTALIEVNQGEYTFRGSFKEIRPATGLYLLNSDGEGFGVGTSNSYVPAFRSYIESKNSSSAVKSLSLGIGDDDTTAIKLEETEEFCILISESNLVISTGNLQTIQLYGIDGRLVREVLLQEGQNIIYGLSKGIYLLNNQKIVLN